MGTIIRAGISDCQIHTHKPGPVALIPDIRAYTLGPAVHMHIYNIRQITSAHVTTEYAHDSPASMGKCRHLQ